MKSSESSPKSHLVREISLASGIALVVGGTIGSGIFKSPSGIAEQLPGPLPMMAVWIVGGLLVLCGALTSAELASAFPYSGGQYIYIREAFGRLPAFLFGWVQLTLVGPAGVGAVGIVFGQYAMNLVSDGTDSGNPVIAAYLAIGAIAIVSGANVYGLKAGTAVQNLTTIAKTAGLLVLIVMALAIGLPKTGGHFQPAAPSGSFSVPMFGLALVSTLWAYDGWVNSTFVGGEFANPRRNIPRAIAIGTLAIIAIYILTNLAYLSVFSVQEIAKSTTIASDTMSRLAGPIGFKFIVATVMISTFGTLSASVLTNPRVFFAMAEDRLFFPSIASVHPRFKTPHVSIVFTSVLGAIYVVIASIMSGSKAFGALTDAFVIGNVPFYALTVASIFVFRSREKRRLLLEAPLDDSLIDPIESGHLETHPHRYSPAVHVPLYPIVPILFLASNLFLIVNSLVDKDSRMPTIITLLIVLAGIPVFLASFGRIRNQDA